MNTPADITVRGASPTARPLLQRVDADPRSLYLHVPFCAHKCHYCDFYSFVDSRDRQEPFVELLIRELQTLAPFVHAPIESVFVGGGTPSMLRPDLWERLLDALRDLYAFESCEFTVECNPESSTRELFDALRRGGVNRVSFGAQSFDARHLQTLERLHTPGAVQRALDHAHDAGIARRSIDLIFGVPGQSLDDWARDLDTALAMRAPDGSPAFEHLSCYALMYEPGTAMTRRLELGHVDAIDPDLEADMAEHTVTRLREAEYERYEVSNFARAGAACTHNLAYWRQQDWLSAGPSGSAHARGARWKNVPHLTEWMDAVRATGWSTVTDLEEPEGRRNLIEWLMTGLRLTEGVSSPDARERAERIDSLDAVDACARACEDNGWLHVDDDRWSLSDAGFLHADSVVARFMSAIDP